MLFFQDLALIHIQSELTSIVLTPLDVKSILKSLPIGKASRPNGLGNRILRELANEVSVPYCCLFNQSLRTDIVPIQYKEANVCHVPRKVPFLLFKTTVLYHFLIQRTSSLNGSSSSIFSTTYVIIIFCLLSNRALYQGNQV